MTADATTPEAPPESRRAILVVDDEPSAVKLMRIVLSRHYQVYSAHTLAESREVLSRIAPDLLILDIRLGEEDGFQLLSEFRLASSAPVLLITGFGSEVVAARGLELRANGYLRKPFDPHDLRTKTASLLAEGPRAEHLAERARSFIDRIATESVVAPELAERLGVKYQHLVSAFRGRYGRTPMQYLREVRLRRAQELLLITDLPVAEIAVRVGFREIAYFDRSFKRYYGITPLECRRVHTLPSATQ